MKIKQDTEQYRKLLRRCGKFFLVVLLTVLLGATGYWLIEGWPFYDGIYMTIITIASVGYREIGDLSPTGRLFTEFLIFIGMAVIAGWVAVVTSFLIDADLNNYFRRKKMIDRIAKMQKHTVICGAGNTGQSVIESLDGKNMDIVLIEQDPEVIKRIEYRFPRVAIVEGNATVEETLWIANIKAARNFVAALETDVSNLYIVITARDLNSNLFIVARVHDDSTAQRVLKAGANEVVSPNRIGGQKMAELCHSRS